MTLLKLSRFFNRTSQRTRTIRPPGSACMPRIGLVLNRPELVDARLEALPTVDEATSYSGHVAVEILRHYGDPNEAVRYAYEFVRKHHEDHIANASLVMAVLGFGVNSQPSTKRPK